jgi:hypothetical protein
MFPNKGSQVLIDEPSDADILTAQKTETDLQGVLRVRVTVYFNHLVVSADTVWCDAQDLRVEVHFQGPDAEIIIEDEVDGQELREASIPHVHGLCAPEHVDYGAVDERVEMRVQPLVVLDAALAQQQLLQALETPIDVRLLFRLFVALTFPLTLNFLHDGRVADVRGDLLRRRVEERCTSRC